MAPVCSALASWASSNCTNSMDTQWLVGPEKRLSEPGGRPPKLPEMFDCSTD
jgi:hypothetical protein